MAYGGLCQWSCVHHRRRRHWQTLRVSLCEIKINLLILLLPGGIAGLTKANLIISVVFLAAVCVICVWLSWKKGSINPSLIEELARGHCTQVTYVMKTHQNSHMLVISLMKDHNIENPLHLNISEANKREHSVLQRADPFHLPLT